MTALSNKHYNGHCKDTEEEGNKIAHGKRDLEMWTARFRSSWRKMEAAAQDRAG